MNKDVLVIGAGPAGIQAALDLADMGIHVHLVEKQPSIGGQMSQIDTIYPTKCQGGCRQCSVSLVSGEPADCSRHPNISLYTSSEVEEVEGVVGAFRALVHKHARYVDGETCISCGVCTEVCPVSVPDEFNQGLAQRKAIYRPHVQSVPDTYLISRRGTAPCKAACPAEVSVQGYTALIAEGRYAEALRVIREHNPFPGTLGRLCDHPCERECERARVDEPVSACALERFAADWVYAHADQAALAEKPADVREDPERVAVVGAGPAGLSAAYYLARRGYDVVVFEAQAEAGGRLRQVSPDAETAGVLQREIDHILAQGVDLRLNQPVDDPDALLGQGFAAVLLATGAQHDEATAQAKRRQDVFIAGDAAYGEGSLAQAVGSGRQAALAIDRYLNQLPSGAAEKGDLRSTAYLSESDIAAFRARANGGVLKRTSGAKAPANLNLTEQQARAEAARCLQCGICADCGLCLDVCVPECIDFDVSDEAVELSVGAVILATGLQSFDPSVIAPYGYGRYPDVVTSREFERLISALGPTEGRLLRPSDGREVKELAFIQCVGSRDERYNPYCSSVCCSFTTQEAIKAYEHDPEVRSTIYYMDLRATAKGFEDCVNRAQQQCGVRYRRARVAEINQGSDGHPVLTYEDTQTGELGTHAVDMVVLVAGLEARQGTIKMSELLGIELCEGDFVETAPFLATDTTREGVFACGFCRGPADIAESVTQGSAAAARAAEFVMKG